MLICFVYIIYIYIYYSYSCYTHHHYCYCYDSSYRHIVVTKWKLFRIDIMSFVMRSRWMTCIYVWQSARISRTLFNYMKPFRDTNLSSSHSIPFTTSDIYTLYMHIFSIDECLYCTLFFFRSNYYYWDGALNESDEFSNMCILRFLWCGI